MGQNRPASSLRDPGVRGCRGGRHPRVHALTLRCSLGPSGNFEGPGGTGC
uniref:Ankyrin repeat domain 45 n=1 Tax=Mus musculus TaxID=10090 RepID=A0A0A6YY30_MOUSE